MATTKLSDLGGIIKTAYENEADAKVNNLTTDNVSETVDKQFVSQTDKDNWDNFQGFSGDYNDLDNRPTQITKVSDLVNDSGFVSDGGLVGTKEVNEAGIGDNKVLKFNELSNKLQYESLPIPFSKEYNDLLNKPTIPTKTSDLTNDNNFVSNGGLIGSKNVDDSILPDDTVMVYDSVTDTYKSKSYQSFSGEYDDLNNKPTIPQDINDLTDLANALNGNVGSLEVDDATIGAGTFLKYNATTGKAEWTAFSAPTNVNEPTYMSELYNDVGYVTDGGKIGSKKVDESGLTGNGMLVYSFGESKWKVVPQSSLTNIVSNVENGTILDGTIQEFLKQIVISGTYADIASLPASQSEDFIAYIEDVKEIYSYKASTGWFKKYDLANAHGHIEFGQLDYTDIDNTNKANGKALVYNDITKKFEYQEIRLTGEAEDNQIASEVPFDNLTSNLTATTVQGAIEQVNTKIVADTVTYIDLTNNVLTYTDENGTDTVIDLSPYLDDTKVVSASLLNGVITFTNSDTSTFTLNVSELLDDTNLITSVSGRTGDIVLVENDITDLDKYTQLETDNLLATKVDKVAGKELSDNNLTDNLLTLLTTKKVKDVTLDAINNRAVITYTDDTVANLNVNDIVTDVNVTGATLDATTNVLTLTSDDGGADVTVNLSDFVNSSELTSALNDYYTKTAADTLLDDKADLSGAVFTGDMEITKNGSDDGTGYIENSSSITLRDSNNSQDVEIIHNPLDSALPQAGYGIEIRKTVDNAQQERMACLVVEGNIYKNKNELLASEYYVKSTGFLNPASDSGSDAPSNDLDNLTISGLYNVAHDDVNMPLAASGSLLVKGSNVADCFTQTYQRSNSNAGTEIWTRAYNGTDFSTWEKQGAEYLLNTTDTLDGKLTVDDSGSYIPLEIKSSGADPRALARFTTKDGYNASIGLTSAELTFRQGGTNAEHEKMRVSSATGNLLVGVAVGTGQVTSKNTEVNKYAFKAQNTNNETLGGIYEDVSSNCEIYGFSGTGVNTLKLDTAGTSFFNGGDFAIGQDAPEDGARLTVRDNVVNGDNEHNTVIFSTNDDGISGGLMVKSFSPRFTMSDLSNNSGWFDWRVDTTTLRLGYGSNTDEFTRTKDDILRITNSGIVEFGGGAKFDNPSTDPTVLDAYEEGTWIPSVAFDGTDDNDYSYRHGNYTRIGNTVHYQILVSMTKGAATGNLSVSFPFTTRDVASNTAYENMCSFFSMIGQADATKPIYGRILTNSIFFNFINQTSPGVADTDFGDSMAFRVFGTAYLD